MRPRRYVAIALTAVLASLAPALTTSANSVPNSQPGPHPGASGAGDPYFPTQGNGGYDVKHYGLFVAYDPVGRGMIATADITATARTNLSRFDLDLRRALHVGEVTVNGARAATHRSGEQELVITPRTDLRRGSTFHVSVDYGGKPHAVHDPDGSLDGWIHTDDGAFVASEPQGSPTWFPVNDTPDDKATYKVTLDLPRGYQGISNGSLRKHVDRMGKRVNWIWRMRKPISSYLVTASIGHFDIQRGVTPGRHPYLIAVDPRERRAADPVLGQLPAIIGFYAKTYGPYPFGWAGAVVDHARRVGYALETATRPLFDRAPSVATLAHELAHQWYGDTVTLHHWRDIWLNEGFAEFSSWLWTEHSGGETAAHRLRDLLAQPASDLGYWNPPPGNPGNAKSIFAGSVYVRGAATLQALREKVGNHTFFQIMRGWLRAHEYGNAKVGQFTAYAAAVAHRDLQPFFRNWLYRKGKPRR